MRKFAFASTAAAGGVAWLSQDYQSGPARTARSLCCGVAIGIDYKVAGHLPHGSDEHAAAMREVHERGAQRLLALCRAHGGLYNKLGQYLASMTSALPPQYTSTLSACQDRAAPVPLVEVRETVETQLGAPLASLFAEFDDAPVAAASLAQVHRAVLLDGRSVAVKVQYPRVAGQVASDLGSMRLLSALAEAAFPGAGYGWIIGEFEASTREELDFRNEAANAAACAALFAADPRVHARDRLALPDGVTEGACSLSVGVGPGSGHRLLPLERARADDGVGRRRQARRPRRAARGRRPACRGGAAADGYFLGDGLRARVCAL